MICVLWSSDCLLCLRCHVTLCDGLEIVVLLIGVGRVRAMSKLLVPYLLFIRVCQFIGYVIDGVMERSHDGK